MVSSHLFMKRKDLHSSKGLQISQLSTSMNGIKASVILNSKILAQHIITVYLSLDFHPLTSPNTAWHQKSLPEPSNACRTRRSSCQTFRAPPGQLSTRRGSAGSVSPRWYPRCQTYSKISADWCNKLISVALPNWLRQSRSDYIMSKITKIIMIYISIQFWLSISFTEFANQSAMRLHESALHSSSFF